MKGLSNWLISKSDVFDSLTKDFRRHKNNTEGSFKRVKRDNLLIVKKLKEQEDRIRELQNIIDDTKLEPIKVYKKSKRKSKR